jgi:hypothetical protein
VFISVLLDNHFVFAGHFVEVETDQKTGNRTTLHHQPLLLHPSFHLRAVTNELSPPLDFSPHLLIELTEEVDVRLKILLHATTVLLQSFLSDYPEPLDFSFLVVLPAVSDMPGVVTVVLCYSESKDGVFSIEKATLPLQFLNGSFVGLFDADQFFIFFNGLGEGLLVQLFAEFFFFEQTDQLLVGVHLQRFSVIELFLLLFGHLLGLEETAHQLLRLLAVLGLVILVNFHDLGAPFSYELLCLLVSEVIVGHCCKFSAVEVLFLQHFCNELVDMSLPDFLFKVGKLILHRALCEFLVLFESEHY